MTPNWSELILTAPIAGSMVLLIAMLVATHIRRLSESEFLVRSGKMCLKEQAKFRTPTTTGLWLVLVIFPLLLAFGFIRGMVRHQIEQSYSQTYMPGAVQRAIAQNKWTTHVTASTLGR